MANLKGRGNGFIIFTDVPGAMGTIPTVANHTLAGWLDTDLYPGETLANITDQFEYKNFNGVIYGSDLYVAPTFRINEIQPESFNQGVTGNVMNISGSRLTGIVFEITSGSELLENIVFELVDDSNATLTFDTFNGEDSTNIHYTLSKAGYIESHQIYLEYSEPLGFNDNFPVTVEANESVIFQIYLNKGVENLDSVELNNGATVTQAFLDVMEEGQYIYIEANTLNVEELPEGKVFRVRVTADEETTEWSPFIQAISTGLTLDSYPSILGRSVNEEFTLIVNSEVNNLTIEILSDVDDPVSIISATYTGNGHINVIADTSQLQQLDNVFVRVIADEGTTAWSNGIVINNL